MKTYWKDYQGNDETFWEHEWSKHGTCVSTYEPSCYTGYQPTEEAADFFQKTVDLFKALPSYDVCSCYSSASNPRLTDTTQWLKAASIVPSSSATYTSAEIQTALGKNRNGVEVTLGCKNGELNEIWYHYNVKGSIQTGEFVAAAPDGGKSTCPATGVKYLPKSGSGGGGTTTLITSTKTTTSAPSSTGGAFAGKGYLNVSTGGATKGCLISAGTWYTSGTCATFTAAASGSGFTLSTSKGKCGVVSGVFTCGSSVNSATVFSADSGNLAASGSAAFYADAVPSGSTQEKVYTASHATSITITWQSV
jgi:ribonuclease T2